MVVPVAERQETYFLCHTSCQRRTWPDNSGTPFTPQPIRDADHFPKRWTDYPGFEFRVMMVPMLTRMKMTTRLAGDLRARMCR